MSIDTKILEASLEYATNLYYRHNLDYKDIRLKDYYHNLFPLLEKTDDIMVAKKRIDTYINDLVFKKR